MLSSYAELIDNAIEKSELGKCYLAEVDDYFYIDYMNKFIRENIDDGIVKDHDDIIFLWIDYFARKAYGRVG